MSPDLVLSATDQDNVQAAIRSMLVCTAHKTFIDWRREVQRALKRLADGDMALSYVGQRRLESLMSEEIEWVVEFPTRASDLITRFRPFERSERLVAWSRSTLWGTHIASFLRSSYYNEFARPMGAIDGVGIAVVVGGVHAGLQAHRDSERIGVYGDRHVALLRLLVPAFEVGIAIAMQHFENLEARTTIERVRQVQDVRRRRLIGVTPHSGRLTNREFEVARLLAARRSNYEIAELLNVSRATAKRHAENILAKLGLHSRRDVEQVIGPV